MHEETALRYRCFLLLVSMPLAAVFMTACDGEGLKWIEGQLLAAGDLTPTSPGAGTTPGTTPPTGPRPDPDPDSPSFTGTWIASYGDDVASGSTDRGKNEYAVRIELSQNRSTNLISGTGTMMRAFREITAAEENAFDHVPLDIEGTVSDSVATLSVISTTQGSVQPLPNGTLDFEQFWELRHAGDKLVGIYSAFDAADLLARSGHFYWYRVDTGDLDATWVTGFSDRFIADDLFDAGFDRRGCTARLMDVNRDFVGTLSGSGRFGWFTPHDNRQLELTGATLNSDVLAFTFDLDGVLDVIDWLGFHTDGIMAAVYGQFDDAELMTHNGYATWFTSPIQVQLQDFNGTWVTCFADTVASGHRMDYLVIASVMVLSGGSVTGTAKVLIVDDSDTMPGFETYTILDGAAKGAILGSRLQMKLRNPAGATFEWDLELGDSVLAGSYQRLDAGENVLGHGSAVWRAASSPSVFGDWAASYFDTFATGEADDPSEDSQLAEITISSVDPSGDVAGHGTLSIVADSFSPRGITLSGSVGSDDVIIWEWGGDLNGPTHWRLRQAGDFLYGVYKNLDTADQLEFRGHALFVRAD